MTSTPRASRARRRPYPSSALTTARGANDESNSRAFAAKYASIDPCHSSWSGVRLVKHAHAKRVPSTRCFASACDVTSIPTTSAPSSAIAASSSCRSTASGVPVLPFGYERSPTRHSIVPTTPDGRPAAAPMPSRR